MNNIGIEAMSFFTPHRYISLTTLANHHGIDPEKFSKGIGQENIALPGHDEDIVTMAAEAARPLIDRYGSDGIDTLFLATESGIDQSKAAGIYVHRLLNLSPNCRTVEFKQACYSATPALQMACSYVARRPGRRVLVIASDVARYDLDSSGEATQGAGAVAMLVSAQPSLLEIGAVSGLFTEDIMDFWRPNHRRTPLYDGKYSALRYLNALTESWSDYQANGGKPYAQFARFCFHLPFSRLGEKAHRHLAKTAAETPDLEKANSGFIYNRTVGNSYTASVYLSLISTLENTDEDLSGKSFGIFSYGSGATAEFFDAVARPDYQKHMFAQHHQSLIEKRDAVSYEDYVALWNGPPPAQAGQVLILPDEARGRYRLAKIDDQKRIYIDKKA